MQATPIFLMGALKSNRLKVAVMKDDKRKQLRSVLLAGAESKPAEPADQHYFARLRERVQRTKPGSPSN